MAPSKLRKAIGAVKDQTSIGLAKVTSSSSRSDLEVAVVKATRHEENPPDERYIREILNLTTYSRALVRFCIATIARRLNKTKNWVVALKALMLVRRLLADCNRAYQQEIFFATRRGTRFLNMSDFRDSSGKADAWDYSAFVRTYALYLDEQLEFKMQGQRKKRSGYAYNGEEEEEGGGGGEAAAATVVRATPVREMKNESIFSRVHHLKQILEKFLACKPTGAAKHNRVVAVALYPIVRESFQLCHDITEIMAILIDRFMQLEVPDMVRVYEVFCRVSKQYDELDAFYDWCKTVGIMRTSEYPEVEKIPQKRLDMMDDFIHQKSAMSQNKKPTSPDPNPKPTEDPKPVEDLFAIKALPPPEGFAEEKSTKDEEMGKEFEEKKESTRGIGDLLNLCDDHVQEEQADKMALALFDGVPAATTAATPPWEAFKESSSGDWETALVQSASHLSNQKASLPGGFDMLMLDGMYQQRTMAACNSGLVATSGSASSVVVGPRPAMLALPAPPAAAGNTDPFAVSLAVPPPAYVQMADMGKKQRLLVEEQFVWQEYARNGMQGQVGLANVQHNNSYYYMASGHTPPW